MHAFDCNLQIFKFEGEREKPILRDRASYIENQLVQYLRSLNLSLHCSVEVLSNGTEKWKFHGCCCIASRSTPCFSPFRCSPFVRVLFMAMRIGRYPPFNLSHKLPKLQIIVKKLIIWFPIMILCFHIHFLIFEIKKYNMYIMYD